MCGALLVFMFSAENDVQRIIYMQYHLGLLSFRARPAIISSNMDTLLSEGLGERATSDLYMARDVCFALLTLNAAATTVLKTSEF